MGEYLALKLRTKIMEEIGLGHNANDFNGSSSCEAVRKLAAEKLEGAISKYAVPGEMPPPNERLIRAVQKVAQFSDEQYSLTKTWNAANEAILAHLRAADLPQTKQSKLFEDAAQSIERKYLLEYKRTEVPRDNNVIGPATARLARDDFDRGPDKSGLS